MSGNWEASRQEMTRLREELREAHEALEAIRSGAVDALVMHGEAGEQVFTLNGADAAYRVLVEAFAEGALTVVGDGTIAYCNRHLAILLDRPLEVVIGTSLRRWVAPEDHAELDRLLTQGRATASKGELHFLRPDGQHVPVQLSCNAIELGGTHGVCAIATDLSTRKRSEELEALQLQLREADRRKDAFLATLAHELRNPLAPIRTAAQLLAMPKIGADVLQRSLGVIQRQVRHMALLLDDLLDVARITQGKLELKRERVSLTTIVDTAVEAARPLIDAKSHELSISLAADVPHIDGDALRLAQIVANLLTNAAKYTDAGGRIELSGRVEGTNVLVSVRDNGIGIPAAALGGIFEMFSQVRGTAARSEGGLGIGLSLVRGLVEMHGGRIEATSAGPDQGSEFIVRLPLTVAEAIEPTTECMSGAPTSSEELKVLIADDNTDAAEMLAVLLRSAGHEVRVAHGGKGALALATAFRPDVVLLDIGMPDLSGYEVARRLRGEPWGGSLFLVALTGWGQSEDKRRAAAAGFDRHMTKPIDSDALESLLRKRHGETMA